MDALAPQATLPAADDILGLVLSNNVQALASVLAVLAQVDAPPGIAALRAQSAADARAALSIPSRSATERAFRATFMR